MLLAWQNVWMHFREPSVSHDLEDGAKRGAELIAENVPLAAPRQRAGSTQRSTERVRTRRTTSAGCVAEQALPLPAQLHDVWEATEELGQDGQALDGALYKLNLPVREDDVGSIISHALLSTDVALQMRNQWSACSGSKHCPIAKDFGEQVYYANSCCWFRLNFRMIIDRCASIQFHTTGDTCFYSASVRCCQVHAAKFFA